MSKWFLGLILGCSFSFLTVLLLEIDAASGRGVASEITALDGELCVGDACDNVSGNFEAGVLGISSAPAITFTEIISGLEYPTDIANAGDGRLFVVEKVGRIRIISGTTLLATPFLDIDSLVTGGTSSNDERGLLGLAFHPDYATNGYFYVSYNFGSGDSRIARYTVDAANPNLANAASALTILEIEQNAANHNVGDLNFGPSDGYLYIAAGDGGPGGDPNNTAQTKSVLQGKILRIDVDGSSGADCDISGESNYGIPAGNPFADGPGGNCDEIWAYGLRNPWRFSFDRLTKDMWMGNVGQGDWEEINFQEAASAGGENYGWRCYEGNHTYNTTGCGAITDYDFPVHEYSSGSGSGNCSVTGGFVYRGSELPGLLGHYLFADYCSNRFWSLSGGSHSLLTTFGLPNVPGGGFANATTFGEDVFGELYVAENGTDASIFKITAVQCDRCTTQDIGLSEGWNMISSYIDPASPALEAVTGVIKNNMVLIKNNGGQVYWPGLTINTIGNWEISEGYQIYMINPGTLTINGQQVDPQQTTQDLRAGWNLIAYHRDNPMVIDQALNSVSSGLLVVKDGLGQIYWPEFGINQIGNMQAGQGYQVFMISPGTVVYPGN